MTILMLISCDLPELRRQLESPLPPPPHIPHHSGLFACRREKFWHQTDGFYPLRQFVTDDARRSKASDFRWWREGGREKLEVTDVDQELGKFKFFSPPPFCMNFPFFAGGEGAKKNFIYLLLFAAAAAAEQRRREKRGMDGERRGMHCYSQSVYPYAKRFPPQADTVSKHILCMASSVWPSNGARKWICRTFC